MRYFEFMFKLGAVKNVKSLLIITVITTCICIHVPLHAQQHTLADSALVKDAIAEAIKLSRSNKLDSAIIVAKKALEVSLQIKYLSGSSRLYTNLGIMEKQRGNYYTALALADSAIYIYTLLNNDAAKAGPYNSKGSSHFELGNYEKAISFYFEALKRYEILNRKDGILSVYNNVALCYNHLGDYNKSLEYHQKSLAMEQEQNNQQGIAASLRNMGSVYHNKKEYSKAIDNIRQSLLLETESKNDVGQGVCYLNIGLTFTEINQFDSASANCSKALEIFNKHQVPVYLAEAHLMKADIHAAAKEDSLAIVNYSLASQIFTQLNALQKVSKVKGKLWQYYEVRNQHKQALETFKEHKIITDSLFNTTKTKAIAEIETKYNTEKKEQQILQLQSEQKLTTTQLNLRAQQLENEKLLSNQKSQQLTLSQKDNQIKTLTLTKQELELQNKQRENEKTIQQLSISQKESQLKDAKLQSQLIKQRVTYGGAAAAIAVGGYIYILYRKRKKLSNQLAQSLVELKQTQQQLIQLEKEKEAEAIRLRISRDIHDDIGSNLTKIAMLGNLASAQSKNKMPEMTAQLDKISDYARSVNNSMSEIIWAVNPRQDTLENLLGYMRVHTEEFLKDTGITYKINFPQHTPSVQLNPDLKRSLFLVLKESLNNAVKYAEAKNIEIKFSISDKNFEMQIADDGKGFDVKEKLNTGNGLQNMTDRISQSGCSLTIQSDVGKGCTVSVNGVIQHI